MSKKWFYSSIIFATLFMVSTAMAAKLSDVEKFGKAVYENRKLSINQNQSCQTCHHQRAAFADPANKKNPIDFPVSEGSVAGLFGGRNAPSAAYAGFSPVLHWNDIDGLFIGGVFWDGRASGRQVTDTGQISPDGSDTLAGTLPTSDPMADQAKGPFLNPIEMALTGLTDVVDEVLKNKKLLKRFKQLFPGAFDDTGTVIYPKAYNNIAEAIAAFERSSKVNRFSSRFDKFAAKYGDVSDFGVKKITLGDGSTFRAYAGIPAGFKSKHLSKKELIGLALFNSDSAQQLGLELPETTNGGMCYLCHLTTQYDTADYDNVSDEGQMSLVPDGVYPPLFTDFSYDNLGVPVNQKAVDLFELSGENTYTTDLGLGGQKAILDDAYGDPHPYPFLSDEEGKFKVPPLRGVAKSAPYTHNGFFATLSEVVNFYNDRAGFYAASGTEAEYLLTMNEGELGDLGMGPQEVDAIVAFMKTLTD